MNVDSASSNRISLPLPPISSAPQVNPAAQNAAPRVESLNKTAAATADVLAPGSQHIIKVEVAVGGKPDAAPKSEAGPKSEPAKPEEKKLTFKDILAKIGEAFTALTDFITTLLKGINEMAKPIMDIASTVVTKIGSMATGMVK